MRLFVLLLLALVSTRVFSYPENTRFGYASCTSCHISPVGGGILTDYGRGTAAAYLPIVTAELTPEPHIVGIGANVRTMHLKERSFLMEAEAELALKLSEQIVFDGSYGKYAGNDRLKSYYLLLKPRPWYSLRAGLITPAYGLNIPDHRANISEGTAPERLAAEAVGYSEYGEIALTAEIDQTLLGRAAVFLGEASQIGVSSRQSPTEFELGVFGILGLGKRFWTLIELDWLADTRYTGYSSTGVALTQGVNVIGTAQIDYSDKFAKRYQATLQIFPVPYTELQTTIEFCEGEYFLLLMTHVFY